MAGAPLFFFGTLCHPPLLAAVAGPDVAVRTMPAVLPDHAVRWVAGEAWPVLVAEPGARAAGLLVEGLDDTARDRIAFYEEGFGYAPGPAKLDTDDGARDAEVYRPAGPQPVPGAPWRLEDWVAAWGEISVLAAVEAMSLYGKIPAGDLAWRLPTMRMRAASRLRAEAETRPATVRSPGSADAVEIQSHARPYSAFFALDEAVLRFPRFDGGLSAPVTRAAFVMADCVSVLPYDPRRDCVMMVEQFRYGPLVRGDRRPWSLEPVAGRIDPGETPEAAARREALEEAGVELTDLELVAAYYASPAAVTEYVFSYVALCDLPEDRAGVGGLAEEHEDIRSHILPFDAAMELVATGEAENGPLVLSLFWLGLHRARLRGAA